MKSRHRAHIERIKKSVRNLREFEWKHQNLIFLFVSIIIAYVLLKTPVTREIMKSIGGFGYAGAFFTGMMFSYALTSAPASATLYILADTLRTPFIIAVIGAAGAMLSDYLIFRFVRDRLLKEIRTTEKEILGHRIKLHINPNGPAARLIPILAGFIIASPLPDELAIAILSATKIKTRKFLQYSFIFNLVGIFIITSLGVLST